ncbi:TPA: Lar family restriction alleviation protein [Stenotrophomonas maltophilia]|nr:Lar family restriction alleviation protein [Stenotrophomonas maltophilia]HDS1020242.1 Lar family restriction alleviation protein [Stenotrophomonas maltophilia]
MSALAAPAAALTPCGHCGSDEVRMRARGSASSRRTAQVVCARCSAQSELCVGADAEAQAVKAWGHKPNVPPAPPAVGLVRGRTPIPEPTLQRDPLELIARMLVGGSFREPSNGRSSIQPLTSADIAGAVGLMRDPVAKQAAVAVALRGQGVSLASLGRALARRVMRQIQWDRRHGSGPVLRMDDPADRWRMRLVLQDAVNDLVWPERKTAAQDAAKAVKMRKGDYLRVYGIAAATLRQALEDGRQEFKVRLFAGRQGGSV